jgi:hypothetical protein
MKRAKGERKKKERLSEENNHHKIAPTSVHMVFSLRASEAMRYETKAGGQEEEAGKYHTQTEKHPIRLLND